MRKILWFCLPAAALFVLLPGVASAKTLAGPSCGATITTSITLKANLDCSAGGMNGLNVGKNGIVINLNGHTITGAGGADGYYGIYNKAYSHVTVENGTVKNFEYGVYYYYANQGTVTKMNFVLDGTKAYYGLYADYGAGNSFSHLKVSNGYEGLATYGEGGDTFSHNTMTGNLYGAYEEYSQHQTWTANTIKYSSNQGYLEDYGGVIMIGNVSSHNGDEGFYFDCDGYGSVIALHNTANYNTDSGIYSYDCYDEGYVLSRYSGNTTNHDYYGIWSDYDWKAKFSGNTADNNTLSGFYYYEPAGYVITKNTSNGNKDNGVLFYTDATYYPALFAKNSSSGNATYGFASDYGLFGTGDTGKKNAQGLFAGVSG